jgi:hypothetical protein
MATQPAATETAGEDEAAPPATTIASLPHALLARVLARVPVDTRLRCCEVSAGWGAFLASERSLWTALDLSPTSGVTHVVTDALLHAAAAKAGGALTSLDVSFRLGECISREAVLAVMTANADSLLEVRSGMTFTEGDFERLLRAAPRLRLLVADAAFDADYAAHMLRNEEVFQPLRVIKLTVWADEADGAALQALAAALAVHAAPLGCIFFHKAALDVHDALDALVDAALTNRLSACTFDVCRLSPACVPPLVRLLGGALTSLTIHNGSWQLLDTPTAALLGRALRTHSTLDKLVLSCVDLWRDAAAATMLLTSLVAHRSLRELDVSFNDATEHAAACAGTVLHALVAANTPALQTLNVSYCNLGDVGLRPLFEALPRNTHLRSMFVNINDMREAFARDVLLPAVRANTSLTKLEAAQYNILLESARKAERIVAQRSAR